MGLGKALARRGELRSVPGPGVRYDVTDLATGNLRETFTVNYGTAPDWPASAYRNGMSIPGAWRGSLILSELLGAAPWQAFRKATGDDPAPRLIDPSPSLLQQPSPPETAVDSWGAAALDYIWNGNAIGVWASRDRAGWPTSVVMVPAESVMVRRVDERNYPLPMGAIEYLIGSLSFTPDEILHIKGPHEPGGLRGWGVLEAHMNTIGAAQQLGADAHTIHGVPTGVLKSENPDLTPKEARKMKAAWLESQRTRTVAVLNASTSFEALAWNPRDAQLIEARKFSLSEWELIFGLPVGWLGGQTSSRQYSNIEQDAINLIKFTLNGHLTRFKQSLTQAFPRGVFVEPDLDALLASDTMNRYTAYAVATGGKPWLLPSEVRARERLAAVEGIDDTATAPAAPAEPGKPGNPAAPDDTTNQGIEEIQA